jgi:hypothetical protein
MLVTYSLLCNLNFISYSELRTNIEGNTETGLKDTYRHKSIPCSLHCFHLQSVIVCFRYFIMSLCFWMVLVISKPVTSYVCMKLFLKFILREYFSEKETLCDSKQHHSYTSINVTRNEVKGVFSLDVSLN